MRHSAVTNKQIKKLESKIGEFESQQRKKIAEVLKVKRFKEGLEKIRAEAKMQFIRKEERLEQKELDEGATIRFVRKVIQRR